MALWAGRWIRNQESGAVGDVDVGDVKVRGKGSSEGSYVIGQTGSWAANRV